MNPAMDSVWQWAVIAGGGILAVLAIMVLVIMLGRGTGEKLVNGD